MGKSVNFIRKFYVDSGADMFEKRLFVPFMGKVLGYEYKSETLQ